ncbi:type IV pilin-like G/H family protein [Synechocystis sp. PCC 7509]|uniref:type IV pilin-like G/H family protein n=1 Tax=Synechocystis sp. PCC 7509 TaxID=927677 RepID=UPI0002AC4A30|nr:type IV pilin-like G/H family protein [Synechocystis sp. PCC 7509]
MKLHFKAKYLQYLNNNLTQGFTLIELLVVIIIIAALAAIALPSYLNQTVKARQAEAKNTIGAINSSQTAFRVANPSFANSIAQLAVGLPDDTVNYTYQVTSTSDFSQTTAQAKNPALKGYSGALESYADTYQHPLITSVLCEAALPGISLPSVPAPGAPPDCATVGMVTVGR